jgi:hypothetical protein
LSDYFAYGSNMDVAQMASRCPGAVLIAPGLVRGYRFRINSRGVATLVPEEGAVVYGLCWTLSAPDERTLDRYEGVGEGLYAKLYLPVVGPVDGQEALCLTYLAADFEPGEPRTGYLDRIVAAAVCQGLPESYITELREWSTTDG